jgi:vacuolar-type H+-ATPase subunit E/Vma4
MISAARGAGKADGAQAVALAPVRAHVLRAARAEAERIIAQARIQAATVVQNARRGADEAVELAEAQGRADGALAAAAERSRGREQARSIVLGAEREAREELCGQVLAVVSGLRAEPGYGQLLIRLTSMAARAAGPDATVTVQPAGGVVARSRGVVVDCTLPRLAGLAVDALGDQVRELWTP